MGQSQGAYLERNMIISKPNLKLLLSYDALFWPVCVVFPAGTDIQKLTMADGDNATYLIISFCSTVCLSSFTTNGPTHTEKREKHVSYRFNMCAYRIAR